MVNEAKWQLEHKLVPFWKGIKDERGGYYGEMNYNLDIIHDAVKGCILNSRILWFFCNTYETLKDESLIPYMDWAYIYLRDVFVDKENGGVYWSVNADGTPSDTTKHTYNQAFAIYALSSYYKVTKNEEALKLAFEIFEIIEERCTDEIGYLEAFDIKFNAIENDKLSENGVVADKTMNTLLHVFEAYSELYLVSENELVKTKIVKILDTIQNKIYNPDKRRQEVFFDRELNSIIDLHSYGHDIETAWLVDRGCEIIGYKSDNIKNIVANLESEVYEKAYDGKSLYDEMCNGELDKTRVWWVQAEAVVGFLNAYQKDTNKIKYKEAALNIWEFIKDNIIDKRENSEWLWDVSDELVPNDEKGIVSMWKCPYHNGRMFIEIIRREFND